MQPFIAAMIKVRRAFYVALVRSLLRTKSLLKAFLSIWFSPSVINGETIQNEIISNSRPSVPHRIEVNEFLDNVERQLRDKVSHESLFKLSDGMRTQMEESMRGNPVCMLPSYNHQLPTGNETGTFLALDVGGSTFRVALIELTGRSGDGKDRKLLEIKSFKIDSRVRQLEGVQFFDWMAQKISQTLAGRLVSTQLKTPLSTGLAWSFPIEQTSLRSGLLQGMGKGFLAASGLIGKDLGDLIEDSCSRHGLDVQMNAIVNDSSATLLSKAYLDSTTRFALILGTGVNAAVHLPLHVFSPSKFGSRPNEWYDVAKHVIVNTELSMFGGGLLPLTKWDEELNLHHKLPDFQPLEHLVGGGYMGEVVRLILLDGIRNAGLFGGVVPETLKERYSLDTEIISRMEGDQTSSLVTASKVFTTSHPTTTLPTLDDIRALRTIASHVSYRATAVLAAGVHALWQLRNDGESISAEESEHTLVAYNGSVMENYPKFREMCQVHLDGLVERSGGRRTGILELVYAEESSLLGAAVAVACSET